ncbi:MAG: FHA domain-containing protein [Planctomycetes bacterium]|nr:FHA domain-containing protein [Planctomycetota bacterium]
MQERFALRFESGDRRGETIGIPSTGLSLGRRPGNSVQVLDASVSGKHAELAVDAQGVLLRDLGSTNGTFVGHERVTGERRLTHRDVVVLGKVRFVFLDAHMGAAPAPAGPAASADSSGLELEGDGALGAVAAGRGSGSASAAGEGLQTISADKLARSGKRSILVGVGLVAVVAAGVGAWWWLQQSGGEAAGPRRPVAELPGNLLAAAGSFEGELTGWEALEQATTRFLADRAAAASGETGARAALARGEWAALRSNEVRATPGKALRATGVLSADGGAELRLGIEFATANGEYAPLTAWADAESGGATELVAWVPPGYDRARAVLLARAGSDGGNANADDVGLLPASDAAAAPKVGEFVWTALGKPVRAGVLGKLDRPILSNVRVIGAAGPLELCDANPLAATPNDDGFVLDCGRAEGRTLVFTVAPTVVAQGVATLGEGGLRTHQVEFSREHVDGLIVGSGLDLVRVRFAAPVELSGVPEGGGFRIQAKLGAGEVGLQVLFQKERALADEAARRARDAEKQGKLGECLAAWRDLLDRAPFDAQLVKEAEAARARLLQAGLAEVGEAKLAAERARFFRLVELFRQVRDRARAIAAKYAPSDVETAALALALEIERDLAGLEQDLNTTERERLGRILGALEAQKMPTLAARVRASLAELPGGTK